jgi:CBS domain-containing protein
MAMWQEDCGAIPVVEDGKPIAVITDRDICMAAALNSQGTHELKVGDVTSNEVFTCKSSDGVDKALAKMRRHKVRRLPVVDSRKKLVGMLSMNDIVLAASTSGSKPAPALEEVLATMQGICEHRTLPSLIEQK